MSSLSNLELKEELDALRQAIRRHNELFERFLEPRHFRLLSLVLGLGLVVVMAGFEGVGLVFSGYDAIPPQVRWGLWFLLGALFLLTGFLKLREFAKVKEGVAPNRPLSVALLGMLWGSVLNAYAGALLLLGFTGAFLVLQGKGVYLVSFAAMVFGLLWNQLGTFVGQKLYYLMGYWFLVGGGLSLLGVERFPFAWAGGVYGLGLVLFGLGGYLRRARI